MRSGSLDSPVANPAAAHLLFECSLMISLPTTRPRATAQEQNYNNLTQLNYTLPNRNIAAALSQILIWIRGKPIGAAQKS
jgi:hypothetical protein